jgi:hypothetical protein
VKPVIFISCGQVTGDETRLGKALFDIVNADGRYAPYFAENQSSLDGVTQNILVKLAAAAAFIAVIHPRGQVSVPDASASGGIRQFQRASVWIEQEIAVLAAQSQAQGRSIPVQVYTRRGVVREGLRSYVMTNPLEFDHEDEVIEHFRQLLPVWTLRVEAKGVRLLPVIRRIVDARDPTFFTLRLALHNAGDERATDGRMRITFPLKFIRHSHIAGEKRRTSSHIEFEMNRDWFVGHELFENLYPGDTTRVVHELWYWVDESHIPTHEDVLDIEIRSGNTSAFRGQVPVEVLQAMPLNVPYLVLPVVGDVSPLAPLTGA